jgi:heme-degrading monooxygenase HmoA
LHSLDNPNKILVASMWQTPEDWEAWQNSNSRHENEILIEKLVEGSPEIEIYNLGVPYRV